jgi:uncharacterized protein
MIFGLSGSRISLALAVAGAMAPAGVVARRGREKSRLQNFDTGTLTIASATGTHEFKIEIARSEAQKEQGLMFRPRLAADAGMLFVYARPEPVAMWMKNTLIPLDMLFVGADGRIMNVAQRAVPHSLQPIYSAGPALAVVELNGGTADRLGIKPGDRVSSAALGAGN